MVQDLLGIKLENLESASLRHNKFLFLGENKKLEQIQAVVDLAAAHSRTPAPLQVDDSFELTLGGRMMLDISTGVLENAGLALHYRFNCPYISGSAIKGVTRHQAWCEWKNASSEKKKKIDQIASRIFGSSLDETEDSDSEQGIISFLRAYSKESSWKLVADILTPHGGNDYTNPTPCPFLAVEKGSIFSFSLRKLSRATNEDLAQAKKWLKQGLVQHGIGAKTIAGYGWFIDPDHQERGIPVELVSPGFFGGANQSNKDDTTLRAPSLRGMLRWWWRTLYRDLLDESKLQELEDALWGSTAQSGWIRLRVHSDNPPKVFKFDYKDRWNPKRDFAQNHRMNQSGRECGLFYMAYGMDDNKGADQRYFCEPNAQWNVLFSVRNNPKTIELWDGISLSADEVLKQARAALSLLCQYGGVGSKSRNGFGSLQWKEAMSLQKCRTVAERLVQQLGILSECSNVENSWSSAFQEEINVRCKDSWTVLDRLGLAVKEVATEYKHNDQKAVFGLPRKIHGPFRDPLRHQNAKDHQPPQELTDTRRSPRFAAPIHYHLEKADEGIKVRIVAFPSGKIRNLETSEKLLKELVDSIAKSLENASWDAPQATHRPKRDKSNRHPTKQAPRSVGGLTAGKEVRVILLEEKTKKGGWKVSPVGMDTTGAVVNSVDVPLEKDVGDEILVIVNSPNPQNPSFRYKK